MNDLLQQTIERLRAFEPAEGYYGAFSGGKDSQVLYHVAQLAGVKVDWHFHLTSVDPPQLLRFIRRNYPDVVWDRPTHTMFQLILQEKMLPTRLARFCCAALKEHGGAGRVVLAGVRAQESRKRATYRMVTPCQKTHKTLVYPLLDWTAQNVWCFLQAQGKAHCELYDYPYKFKRIGCIGCPMRGKKLWRDFRFFPNHRRAYLNTIDRLRAQGLFHDFASSEAVFTWWVNGKSKQQYFEQQRQYLFCFD